MSPTSFQATAIMDELRYALASKSKSAMSVRGNLRRAKSRPALSTLSLGGLFSCVGRATPIALFFIEPGECCNRCGLDGFAGILQ